ncbi:titin [Trichonephila clavipes]|nr:titin [Trichonephila clavipes]
MIVFLSLSSNLLMFFQLVTVAGLNPPTIKPFHFSGELREGLRTMVMCGIIDGDRPFEFKWFKDGEPLSRIKTTFLLNR